MKTKDGYECITGKYYYTEKGQQVRLESCATTPEGCDAFLVTPFYEGEAIEASGDGGYHHEITCAYEHEGETTLVFSIFSEVPLEKLSSAYKEKLVEIERLSLAIGEMQKSVSSSNLFVDRLRKEERIAETSFSNATKKLEDMRLQLSNMDEKLFKKRRMLSELRTQ